MCWDISLDLPIVIYKRFSQRHQYRGWRAGVWPHPQMCFPARGRRRVIRQQRQADPGQTLSRNRRALAEQGPPVAVHPLGNENDQQMQTETYPGPSNPQGAGSTPAERIELRRFDSNVYLATSVHTRSGCGLSVCLVGRLWLLQRIRTRLHKHPLRMHRSSFRQQACNSSRNQTCELLIQDSR